MTDRKVDRILTLGIQVGGGWKYSLSSECDRPFFQIPLNPESQVLFLSPEGKSLSVLLNLSYGKSKLRKKNPSSANFCFKINV